MSSKKSNLALFVTELSDAFETHMDRNKRPYMLEIQCIAEQLYDAGFRRVGKHARIVTEFEWGQLTTEPFVGESYRNAEFICGYCKDSGMSLWIMGDTERHCPHCEKGKTMEPYCQDPFPPTPPSRQLCEKFLGKPLTDQEYESILAWYNTVSQTL